MAVVSAVYVCSLESLFAIPSGIRHQQVFIVHETAPHAFSAAFLKGPCFKC